MSICEICGEDYSYKCDKCGRIIVDDKDATNMYDTYEIRVRVLVSEKKIMFLGKQIEEYKDKKSQKKANRIRKTAPKSLAVQIRRYLAALAGPVATLFAAITKSFSSIGTENAVDVTTELSSLKDMSVEGRNVCFAIKKKKFELRFATPENAALLYETWKKNIPAGNM